MLRCLGVETAEVRLPRHLADLDGLIIPGGESTTIGKLAVAYQLMSPLQEFGKTKAIWGHLRRGHFYFQRCTSRSAFAGSHGYHGGT